MIFASLLLAIITIILNETNPFTSFGLGYILSQMVIYTGISFVIGGVPSLIIYLNNKKLWTGFFATIWIIWFLIATISMSSQIMYMNRNF